MTPLTKPKTFKVQWPDGTVMNVQLDPAGPVIRFREPRVRRWLDFPLTRAYNLAAAAAAEALIEERKNNRRRS